VKEKANTRMLHDAYDEFSRFHYLEERKNLTKQERFDQDKERFKLEDQYGSKIKDVCQEILHTFKNEIHH
jgi:hypothetical protein